MPDDLNLKLAKNALKDPQTSMGGRLAAHAVVLEYAASGLDSSCRQQRMAEALADLCLVMGVLITKFTVETEEKLQ